MRVATLLVLLVLAQPPIGATEPSLDTRFLATMAATGGFNLGHPASPQLTPDGRAVLFLRSPARSFVRDLYELDTTTGEVRVLLTAAEILAGADERLTAEELARRERQRLVARGIASFELSADGRWLLVPLSGRLFVVDRASKAIRELPAEGGTPIDARFSPDGQKVACVRDGDLWVIDVVAGTQTRLTATASPTLSNATAEFVAQEEMDRDEGYWWAPDSQAIAFQETDEAAVELLHIADPARPERAPTTFRYPRPGKTNAAVRLGVVAVGGGPATWVDWDRVAYPYLAKVTWSPGAPLSLLVQNRHQTEKVLLAAEPRTGTTRELLRETDPAWLNLDPEMPHWLGDGSGFLWTSEREGAWRLELRRADGSLERSLTPLDFGLRSLAGVDEQRGLAYVVASDDPTEAHLWQVPLRATGGSTAPRRLTTEPGQHGLVLAKDGGTRLHTTTAPGRPRQTLVEDAQGRRLAELPSVAERPELIPNLEFTSVPVERDGQPLDLHAVVVRPRQFDPARRYPVLVSVYGGPHAQTVRKHSGYLKEQWAADQGFIVVALDGRGTPSRGRAFERAIRGDLIGVALADHADGLRALAATRPQLDLDRVGIYGWSFGGYFTAMAVMQRPELYRAGVAGAPVVAWEDYDTHYTERYLGLPQEAPEAYRRSSVLTYAAQLERPLLVVHGTADDNVYFSHALKLADTLLRAGRQFDFLPLVGFTHVVAEPTVVERWNEAALRFFRTHLGADPR